MSARDLVLGIDQGTTGSRAAIVDASGTCLAEAYRSHAQHHPRPGLVEHDAVEILDAVRAVIEACASEVDPRRVAAVGITNQRETVVVWDRVTGEPIAPAIVWQDARTAEACAALTARGADGLVRERTGLPIQPYFSAAKVASLLDSVPDARRRAEVGELAAGTMECWLAWNLTGLHISDVTNASRTSLAAIDRGEWDSDLLALFDVPVEALPEIVPTWEEGGLGGACVRGTGGIDAPLAAMLGDQQSALLGQDCRRPGEAKCTYGTGAFLLVNAGPSRPTATASLLVSPAYQPADEAPVYCLEGAMAVAGRAIQWLADELGLIDDPASSGALASQVPDSAGVRVVPAFQGLYAPWWDANARGAILGLTLHATRAHVVRATIEALAFQTRAVLDAAERDGALRVPALKIDGGATRNPLLVQALADVLGRPVVCAADAEATIGGVIAAAGMAAGLWAEGPARSPGTTVEPAWSEDRRESEYREWMSAVECVRAGEAP